MKKNLGYIAPVPDPKLYLAGVNSKLPKVVLQPDRDWSKSAPKFEPQCQKFETYNCASFNTLNPIETIFKRLGIDDNYSDRWVGIIAGTDPARGGNSPVTVAEAIRKNGLIPESMLPWGDYLENVGEYYSFKGADEVACRKAGQEWLDTWEFGYEVVPLDANSIKEALLYSPLGVAVNAWRKEGDLYSSTVGEGSNHWTMIIRPQWLIEDSYIDDGTPLKNLTPDYPFGFILRYHLALKPKVKKKLPIWKRTLELMSMWLDEIMK